MVISTLTADEALSRVGRGIHLLCFAQQKDVEQAKRLLEFFAKARSTNLIRVDPLEAATTFQLSRHPTFVLYCDGNERWQALGIEELSNRTRQEVR